MRVREGLLKDDEYVCLITPQHIAICKPVERPWEWNPTARIHKLEDGDLLPDSKKDVDIDCSSYKINTMGRNAKMGKKCCESLENM